MDSHDAGSSVSVSASTFATLKAIHKINGPVGYLKWDREVTEVLKWTRLWKYTHQDKPDDLTVLESLKWDENTDLCCTALRAVVDGGLYHDIKNLTTAKAAWEKIVEVCIVTAINLWQAPVFPLIWHAPHQSYETSGSSRLDSPWVATVQ